MTGGDYIPFDPAGSRKAIALLEGTEQAADLRVRVEGTKDRGMLIVQSIALVSAAIAAPKSAKPAAASQRATVAILLFDGVQTIDYTGPYEVLSDARSGSDNAFRVVTVAENPGTIRTVNGMVVTPDYTLANAPHADIVVLPGGSVLPILDHPAVMAWVRKASAEATHVLSVCNGSFFLARAGLLDGLEATTTAGNLAALKELAPRAVVTGRKRVTDNGKIITTGGLAAGIDGALHLVGRMTSEQLARGLALYLEYNWQAEGAFLPGALAFRHLTPMLLSTLLPLEAELVSSEGDAKHWVVAAKLETLRTPAEIASMFRESAAAAPGWSELASARTATASCFAFRDYDDSAWKSCYELAPASNGGVAITLRAEADAPAVARK